MFKFIFNLLCDAEVKYTSFICHRFSMVYVLLPF